MSAELRYPVPAGESRIEIRVMNSRFICTAGPVFSVEEARAFVARIRAEFADASHNVPAYVVGYGASVTAHCSDDGEPAGTAGRPVLAVLQGSGLGDIAVVVTRYFGGTLLGTGGLVRAYGDSVKAVLEVLPRAEKVATHTVGVVVPYSFLERARRLIAAHRGQLLDESFAADVTLTVRFVQTDLPEFVDSLNQMSNGTIDTVILESGVAMINRADEA